MRIIDEKKQHDYYDIGLGLGHDDSIVYVRDPKEIDLHHHKSRYVYREQNFRFHNIFIGFCGKIYPAFQFHAQKEEKTITGICYTIEEIDKFVHTNLDKHEIESYNAPERKNKYRIIIDQWWRPYWSRKSFISSLELLHTTNYPGYYTKLFAEHNTPIFVVNPVKNKVYINCLLKPWEFYKVFDPYSAFQEISMYVGGVLLASTKPIPPVSDEIRAESHGFNEWSFRKESEK